MSIRTERVLAVVIAAALLALCGPSPAVAHHILGIPHYSYDEDYPQTPVVTYRVQAGAYEVKVTGYPGVLEPGDQCVVHLYISNPRTGELYDGTVSMTVECDRLIGEDPVVYGPVRAQLDERLYKFYPRFDAEADYSVQIHFEAGDVPWDIELPFVVGEPGSSFTLFAVSVFACVLFLVIVRAVRIKAARRA